MTHSALVALPLYLLTLAGLLLWAIIGSRGSWYLKAAFILIVPMAIVPVWVAVHSYLGWPAPVPTSGKFILIAATVREPDESRRDPGAIYLWVRMAQTGIPPALSWIGYHVEPTAPRAFRMEYTRERHMSVAAAQQRLTKGIPVGGEFTGGDLKGDGQSEGDGSTPGEHPGTKGRGNGRGGQETIGGEAVFYELPPVNLPPKNAQ